VVAILRSGPARAEFNEVVGKLLRGLEDVLRRKEPALASFATDAAAAAALNIMHPACLARLRDAAAFDSYAVRATRRELLRIARLERRLHDLSAQLRTREEKAMLLARSLPFLGHSAADLAHMRRVLDSALRIIRQSPVAWWKMVERLPEEEITRRTGLTHDQIQGIVRRIRAKIREILRDEHDDDDPGGKGGPG
jgi:hypothetical protein